MARLNGLLAACVLCVSLTAVVGSCPQSAISQYFGCVDQAEQQKKAAEKEDQAAMKANEQNHENAVQVCYKNTGCIMPPKPPPHGGPHHNESSQNNQSEACLKPLFEQIGQNVTKCVLAATGLSQLPEGHKPHGPPGHGPPGHGGPPGKPGPHKGGPPKHGHNPHLKACENTSSPNTSADSLAKCLEAIPKPSPPPFLPSFCAAKNSCLASLTSAGCNKTDVKNAYKQIDQAEGNCRKQQNPQAFAANIGQCNGLNVTQLLKGPKGGPGGKGPKGGHSNSSEEGGPHGPGGPKGGHSNSSEAGGHGGHSGPSGEHGGASGGEKEGHGGPHGKHGEHGGEGEEEEDECEGPPGGHHHGGPHGSSPAPGR